MLRSLTLPFRKRARGFRPRLETLEARLTPVTVRWNLDASGFWDVGSNWDTGTPPVSGDDVVIDRPAGNFTVTYRQGAASILSLSSTEAIAITGGLLAISTDSTIANTLSFSDGTLGGLGTLTVDGLFTWTGGTLSGVARTVAAGGLAIGGAAAKNLEGRLLEHAGTATWDGTGEISAGDGSVWLNPAGSTLNIRNSAGFFYSFSGDAPLLHNEGTLQKSVNAGVTTMQVRLENAGVVQAQTGTLALTAGSASTGRFTVSAGATLEFRGGTHALNAGSRVEGGGTALFSGAALNATVAGEFDMTGSTRITGGQVAFNAPSTTAGGALTAGILTGTGLVTVTGAFSWTGGTMAGTGTTSFAATATLTLDGGAKELARTLENAGTVLWQGTGDVNLNNGATINNQAGALFDARGNARFLYFGGALPNVNNAGTFRKSAGGGITRFDISVRFNNNNLVEVQNGTLALAGGTSGGTFAVSAGTILNFAIDIHTVTATGLVTGQGTARFTGGTTNIAGTYDIENTVMVLGTANFSRDFTVLHVTQSGGTITGTANFTILTTLTWSGGTLGGPGSTFIQTTATFNITGSLMTLAGRNITHASGGATTRAIWTGTGTINTTGGPIVTVLAGAIWDVRGDSSFTGNGTFMNAGTYMKSAGGAGATTFGAGMTFTNNELVLVLAGRLTLSGAFTNFAAQTLTGGTYYIVGTFQFVGADLRINQASVILSGPSSAIVNQGGGNGLANFHTNHVAFVLESGRNLGVAAFTNTGDLVVGETCAFTASGLFTFTGGSVSGLGTLNANGGMDLNSQDYLLVWELTVNLAATSTWSAGLLVTGNAARLNVIAGATLDLTFDGYGFHVGGNDSLITNAGTFRKTAGEEFAWLSPGLGFTNTGALVVSTGYLELAGGLTNFDEGTGALTGGTYTLAGVLVLPGNGIVANQAAITLTAPSAGILDGSYLDAFRTLALNGTARVITLQNGASLITDAATFTNSGQLSLQSGSSFLFRGSAFSNTSQITVNAASLSTGGDTFTSSGPLAVQNGGSVSTTATTVTNTGQLTLAGATTLFTASGDFVNSGGTGMITVGTGARLVTGTFRQSSTSGGALTINATSRLETGAFTQTAGTLTINANGRLDADAASLTGGTLTINTNALLDADTLTQTAGTLNLAGGRLTAAVTIRGGAVAARGTITGTVQLENGQFNIAGATTGSLTIVGDFTQTGGILQVHMRTDTDFDRLFVTGTATLGGTLQVRMLNSYQPLTGTPFQILSASQVDGMFGALDLPAGIGFDVGYNGTDMTLTAL